MELKRISGQTTIIHNTRNGNWVGHQANLKQTASGTSILENHLTTGIDKAQIKELTINLY